MFQVVGNAATLATDLVVASGADNHLEMGRCARLVPDQKQMFARALLGGRRPKTRQQQ
jgi:hypothetical protein